MTRRQRIVRAVQITLGVAALQTGSAMGLGLAQRVPLTAVNVGLLFLATSVLGGAWALRQRLDEPEGVSFAASAAAVPVIAMAVFLGPQLYDGSARAATIAAVALFFAPVTELMWSRWLGPDVHATAFRAGLVAAPLAGLGLATAMPLLIGVGLVGAGFVAALTMLHARSLEEEREAFALHVRRSEVQADRVVRPTPPVLADPALRALERGLSARCEEFARETEAAAVSRADIADARAMRARFMAVMGHELRSPLISIVGFTEVLERGIDGALSEGQLESLSMVHRSADELIMLLTDVLDLARLEAGRLTLQREWTPSVEILTESVARGRALVLGRDVEIEAELQPGLPPVHVDARRVLQAVVALFRNAASSLRHTTIQLRARVAEGPPGPLWHLRVEIRHAIGAMPAGEVEKIFEAFQEISEPSGRRLGGLGMALTLSRGLLRLHGGEVWAETALGAGTVLCIAIPLDDAPSGP